MGSALYLIFSTCHRKKHTNPVTVNNKMEENAVEDGAAPPHSVFSKFEKGIYVYIASLAAFASPVSSSIYYPAMTTLAMDLHTSLTNISLTITTYMVIPTFSTTRSPQVSLTTYNRYSKVFRQLLLAVFQIDMAEGQRTCFVSSCMLQPISVSLYSRNMPLY